MPERDGLREILPVPDRRSPGASLYDAKDPDVQFPPIRPLYDLFGLERTHVRADEPAPPGEHQVWLECAYDGGGIGEGGDVTLYLDGHRVGAGRVERTEPIGFGSEYTDVGRDAQSPVTDDYSAGDTAFTGTIKWIEMEAGTDSHDHLVDPGQIFHYAMAKQ